MAGVNITLEMGVLAVATNSHQLWVWSSLHIFNSGIGRWKILLWGVQFYQIWKPYPLPIWSCQHVTEVPLHFYATEVVKGICTFSTTQTINSFSHRCAYHWVVHVLTPCTWYVGMYTKNVTHLLAWLFWTIELCNCVYILLRSVKLPGNLYELDL